MALSIAAEPGTELFRDPEEDDRGWDIAFGPIGEDQAFWSLFRLCRGVAVERVVLFAPRPSQRDLRVWLTEVTGKMAAGELLGRVGRLQPFYATYYSARPDLERRHLVAFA